MRKETINEKIRNQLSPIANLIELIKLLKNTMDERDRIKYENILTTSIQSAEISMNKLCELGYNIYELNEG